MNETFPATPISIETFAQRLIMLDTLRHAIVELWDFCERERHGDGFTSRDILRLEEIRQIVTAERPLLGASRETALQYKEILRSHAKPTLTRLAPLWAGDGYVSVTVSPREKSKPNEHDTIENSALVPRTNASAPPAAVTADPGDGHSPVTPANTRLSLSRSAPAPRKADAKIRRRGKKGRRRRRPA